MSNDKTEIIPTVPTVPTRRSVLRAAVPAPFADWRGRAPTEELPATARVSTLPEPTGSREALRTAPTGTKGLRRQGLLSRHLRAALAGIALAAAILIPMQLFAAQGISSARQAALAARPGQTSASAVPMSGQSTHSEQGAPSPMSGQSPAQPDWVTEHTGAAYDRTNPHASPLDLPRCTTSPDTPLPCLATISPDSRRAVVLGEDTSLTALVQTPRTPVRTHARYTSPTCPTSPSHPLTSPHSLRKDIP